MSYNAVRDRITIFDLLEQNISHLTLNVYLENFLMLQSSLIGNLAKELMYQGIRYTIKVKKTRLQRFTRIISAHRKKMLCEITSRKNLIHNEQFAKLPGPNL